MLEDALSRVRALVIVSVVALVVGLFIVYNSVSISVVERLRDLAILRAIGARRRQVLALVLIEWTALGAAGSAAGLAAGYGLASLLVSLSARSANALMLSIDVREVVLTFPTAVAAIVCGTAVSFLAALLPAMEAMRVPPAGLLGSVAVPGRDAPRHLRSFFAGVALIGAASVPSSASTSSSLRSGGWPQPSSSSSGSRSSFPSSRSGRRPSLVPRCGDSCASREPWRPTTSQNSRGAPR